MFGESTSVTRYTFWLIILLIAMLGVFLIYHSARGQQLSAPALQSEVSAALASANPPLDAKQTEAVSKHLLDVMSSSAHESTLEMVIRDIGISLVLAAIVVRLIETYAHERMVREVSYGVIEATFRRLIPEAIFEEVRAYVLSAPTTKRNWRISMTLEDDPAVSARHPGFFVSTTVLEYELQNAMGIPTKAAVTGSLDVDLEYRGANGDRVYPRYESAVIGSKPYSRQNLLDQHILSEGGTRLRRELRLKAREKVQVSITLKELIATPDTTVWTTSQPTDGAEIITNTSKISGIEFAVHALHPDEGRLQPSPKTGNAWEFKGGLLPWQGFRFVTRRVAK